MTTLNELRKKWNTSNTIDFIEQVKKLVNDFITNSSNNGIRLYKWPYHLTDTEIINIIYNEFTNEISDFFDEYYIEAKKQNLSIHYLKRWPEDIHNIKLV